MNFDPTPLDGEHLPKHELLLDISETTLQLISAMRILREPDIKRALLYVDVDRSDFVAPAFIRRNIASDSAVQEIVIDATINRLTDKAELALRIDIAGPENLFMNISTGEPDGDNPESSLIVNDLEMPCLEPATYVEVNRFLASLFVKNKTGDYSAFDAMDLGNALTTERLIDALEDVARETILDETYFLGETLGPATDSVSYTQVDGVTQNAIVSIEHHAKASAIEISFTKQMNDTTPEDDTDSLEFMMQRLEGARTFVQDVDGASTQVESTNDFLIVVRDFLKEQSGRVFHPSDEPLGDLDLPDPTLSINIDDQPNN